MKLKLIIACAVISFAAANTRAATNSWSSSAGDFWDSNPADWSLGNTPSITDAADLITNATTKTVTIDILTTSFAQPTLTISNLTVAGVGTTTNTLYLSNAGTTVPLRILNGLAVTNGGILQITNSFLRVDGLSGGLFKIDGAVRMTNGLIVTTNTLTVVGASGAGTLGIVGGTWQAGSVQLGGGAGSQATLTIARGAVSATNALGTGIVNVLGGTLTFNGGTNTFDALVLTNGISSVMIYNGGKLRTTTTVVSNDAVLQFALGTNSTPAIVNSNLTLGGTLNVTDGGGFTVTSYTLFTYGGTLTYNGLTIGTIPNGSSGYLDTGTIGQVSLVVTQTALSAAFPLWQLQYFGCSNCPQAQPDADPLGKGMSNTNQFLAGLNPTNANSALRITSIVATNATWERVTWKTSAGDPNAVFFYGPTIISNIVQGAVGTATGAFSNNFYDISGSIILVPSGSGDTTTNYVDQSGTNRYYRIRLVP